MNTFKFDRFLLRFSGLAHNHWIYPLLFFLVGICIFSPSPAFSAEYYLSPNGSDYSPGTSAEPWKTLAKANQSIYPGDIVTLMPGSYSGYLKPARSGTAEAPIIFRAATRRTARIEQVWLDKVDYIHIEGLHIEPSSSGSEWFASYTTKHVTVTDCLMENAKNDVGIKVYDSEHFTLRDSVMQNCWYPGTDRVTNMIKFQNCRYIVIEGNSITRAGHSPLQFYPPGSNQYIVIRGNVFHAAWSRNFELFSAKDVLFENNIIAGAYDGGQTADPRSKFFVDNGIFRFNRVYRNSGIPLGAWIYYSGTVLKHARMYNNVFHDNYEAAWLIGGGTGELSDIIFQNNIFYGNDPGGSGCQIRVENGNTRDVKFFNNVFKATQQGATGSIWFNSVWSSVSAIDVSTAQSLYPSQFQGNLEIAPQFLDESNYGHGLSSTSPLRDAGKPLTQAVGSGDGDTLQVADVSYFFDGFGIEGEIGDLIVIGTSTQEARVVQVDRSQNTLKLDRSVTWSAGDPVSLPWTGSAPDIGVYEYGDEGMPVVRVSCSPFKVTVGQTVQLSVSVSGISPQNVRWQLGDGTIHEGISLSKSYSEPYDYPIRVVVTDDQGQRYYGTGYVLVEESTSLGEKLVHNTFGSTDDQWKWRWKTYRPTPAAYEISTEGQVESASLHVYAPSTGAQLSAQIAPAMWDIDAYPLMSLRYRIDEGTPLALYLILYAEPGLASDLVCAAKTSNATITAGNYSEINQKSLQNDGTWHQLQMDVREIRNRFAHVKMLKNILLQAAPSDQVTSGKGYWIDEFVISAEEPSVQQPPEMPVGLKITSE